MIKVSIIVPVYNVEKFLEKCLDSLTNQTLKDIEIICVNDGSTDKSFEILNNYAKQDLRIKIINQKNSGLSAARNSGMNIAQGKYIGFVDSDDWVDLDFFEKLYNVAIKNNADISTASIIRWRKRNTKYRIKYSEEKTYTKLQDKMNCCNTPKICYVWNKLYKSTLLKDEEFKSGVYFEDVIWLPHIIKKSNIIVTTPNTNYYYRVNKYSIVKKTSNKKQQDNYLAKKQMIKFFKENNLKLGKRERTLVKYSKEIFKIPLLKIKERDNKTFYLLFDFIPIFVRKDIND